jgi:MATE family multidrug resistance protein
MQIQLRQYTKEFKVNLLLAYPVIVGQVGHLLIGVADDMMVGRLIKPNTLAATSLAATSLGNSLIFIAMSIGIGFSFAITPIIAQADGENNHKKGRLFFNHSMIMMLALSLFLVLAMLLMTPILEFLRQDPDVVELAKPYFNIVAISILPMLLFQGLKQFSDGLSQTKFAMQVTLITLVLNVFLNYVLITGWYIFPEMGIVGAAIGTLISRVVMLILMYLNIKRRKRFKSFLKPLKLSELDKTIFIKITKLGVPSSLQMLFEVGIFTASIILAGMIGKFPQAANQIAIKLAATTFMISIGIGVATTIRVGNQKGMQKFSDLRRIAFSNFLLIVIIMSVFSLLFILFKNQLPLLFISNQDVIQIASSLLVIVGVFQISDGLQAVVLAALRGLQDVKIPTFITFIAYWLIGFPICYYLGLHTDLKTYGIWIGLFISLTVSAILLLWRFHYLTSKLVKK